MYKAVHSLIVSDKKGGAVEIAPGTEDLTFDAKEAEILLRAGAIKLMEGQAAPVVAGKPGRKSKAVEKAEKAVKEAAEAAAAAKEAAEAAAEDEAPASDDNFEG